MKESMEEYHLFHSMVGKPTIAQKCIKSFVESTGCVLFMPACHTDDEIYRYDASHDNALTLWSYYGLVLSSFTGLSTLLGMTDTVDVQDYTDSGGIKVWPIYQGEAIPETMSILNPRVCVRDFDFKYIQRHIERYNRKGDSDSNSESDLMLQRRFEYNFRLCGGFYVIMLHLSSSDCPQVLHLVEVYEVKNPMFRFILKYSFILLSMIFVRSNKKLKQL